MADNKKDRICYSIIFSSISRKNFNSSHILDDEVMKTVVGLRKGNYSEIAPLVGRTIPKITELTNHAIVSIVFAAMALEAYIYDYAARTLGDNFKIKEFDKQGLLKKYANITQLRNPHNSIKNKNVYQLLKKLITARNGLVHNKSKKINRNDPIQKIEAANDYLKLHNSAENAIRAMDAVVEYIESIDPQESVSSLIGEQDSPSHPFTSPPPA